MSSRPKPNTLGTMAVAILLSACISACTRSPQNTLEAGGPIQGLTDLELSKFENARQAFARDYSVKEGIGPDYNATSCAACHGGTTNPAGAGSYEQTQSLVRFGSRRNRKMNKETIRTDATSKTVHLYDDEGMGLVETKSITRDLKESPELKDLPAECAAIPIYIPKGCDYMSVRLAPPLYGLGLINAIPDKMIDDLEEKQTDLDIDRAGQTLDRKDRLTFQNRTNRFGYKCIESNLLLTNADMMNESLGITTAASPKVRYPGGEMKIPECLRERLPAEPNDNGKIQAALTYFVSLLSPPARGPITAATRRGEKLFESTGCAFCHTPELRTGSTVRVVDPDSPFPEFNFLEIKALENKPVRAYSDFLVHDMGNALSDGIPEGRAAAREWRTTPLWGLRLKKRYLHDGQCTTIEDAVKAHAGQAETSSRQFESLSVSDKEDLLAFLRSL
jgi:CxxC motif-containing protein (DUF1111 family)